MTVTTVNDIIDKVIAEGDGWPNDAVFKIEYRETCWPIGKNYAEPPSERYCVDQAEVDAWKEDYSKWASLEGNSVEYTIYRWDLGPVIVESSFY